jgi:hypothetical protein
VRPCRRCVGGRGAGIALRDGDFLGIGAGLDARQLRLRFGELCLRDADSRLERRLLIRSSAAIGDSDEPVEAASGVGKRGTSRRNDGLRLGEILATRLRLDFGDPRLRHLGAGCGRSGLCAHGLDGRARGGDSRIGVARIDFDERLARGHAFAFGDEHLRHDAADLRADQERLAHRLHDPDARDSIGEGNRRRGDWLGARLRRRIEARDGDGRQCEAAEGESGEGDQSELHGGNPALSTHRLCRGCERCSPRDSRSTTPSFMWAIESARWKMRSSWVTTTTARSG